MSKAEYSVSTLVSMIENGDLQLPEMQRQYVWTATKVRDLLDSLYRGYPSGIILAWKVPHGEDVETRDFAVATTNQSGASLLLLDGQQRLTSLSSVLRGEPVSVKWRKTPVEILFNLDHPNELTFITEVNEDVENDDDADDEAELDPMIKVNKRAFVVSSNAVLALPNWVRVTDVFTKTDGEILKGAGLTGWDDPRFEVYSARLQQLRAIKDYVYRAEVLEETKSYEEVTEIFVRVNSLGAKLRGSDLALAQVTAKWRGSLQLFMDYQEEVKSRGYAFDIGVYLRALVAVSTGRSKFLTVSSLNRVQLESGWGDARRAFDFALDYIQTNLRIDSPTLLSSPLLVIATAYWAHQRQLAIDPDEATAFRTWFLLANAKGRYSRGASESMLDQDFTALRGGGGVDALLAQLERQVGRLDFTANDLLGRTVSSGVFKTMFLLFKERGARDWATSLQISPKHSNAADKIEFHHVFPKAFLKERRPDLADREINDIANLAFIGSTTNKHISAKTPSVYQHDYPALLLREQFVLFEQWGSEAEDYETFLTNRREEIASALDDFVRVPPDPATSTVGAKMSPGLRKVETAPELPSANPLDQQPIVLVLTSRKASAKAHLLGSTVRVLRGSRASSQLGELGSYAKLRTRLEAAGLISRDQAGAAMFTHDVDFDSVSAAATVILGTSSNGRKEWLVEGAGLTLRQWQEQRSLSQEEGP